MLYPSRDTEMATGALCINDSIHALLARSASSISLRSVMSLVMPMTPVMRPWRSRLGILSERKVCSPSAIVTASSIISPMPVRMIL